MSHLGHHFSVLVLFVRNEASHTKQHFILLRFWEWIYVYENVTYGPSHWLHHRPVQQCDCSRGEITLLQVFITYCLHHLHPITQSDPITTPIFWIPRKHCLGPSFCSVCCPCGVHNIRQQTVECLWADGTKALFKVWYSTAIFTLTWCVILGRIGAFLTGGNIRCCFYLGDKRGAAKYLWLA